MFYHKGGKNETKKVLGYISFIFYNGEYEIAADPKFIDVVEKPETEKIIDSKLNIDSVVCKLTTTPYSLVYEFTYFEYTENNDKYNVTTATETIFVTVAEQLTLQRSMGISFRSFINITNNCKIGCAKFHKVFGR